jgi:hypothetical protein
MKNIKNQILYIAQAVCLMLAVSCSDYLSVVPDDIPTMDDAFSNHTSTEKFLFTCYSYLPNPAEVFNNSGPGQSRETWFPPEAGSVYYWLSGGDYYGLYSWRIAKGEQTTNDPLLNYWDGKNGGKALFTAIRDCNIFLENVDKATGITNYERNRWIAEVKFLKAYYHFMLLRQYGPIPIIRENIDVSASPEQVRVFRDPVEDVAAYIVELLDEAAAVLPPVIELEALELGRVTKPAALAVKAIVLTMMASPLFNGNPYVRNYSDSRGTMLFPQQADPAKWQTAADAIREAITCAETEGRRQLFEFIDQVNGGELVQREMSIRGAITERWNNEIIWGSVRDDRHLQLMGFARFEVNDNMQVGMSGMGVTLEAAERFYTSNGLPITEDREYQQLYHDLYATSTSTKEDSGFVQTNFITANINLHREPRYYASVTFDGCFFFGNSNQIKSIGMKSNNPGGGSHERYTVTGMLAKKVVNRESVFTASGFTSRYYSYPFIRLADLYLLYAEALNETKAAPDNSVYEYIDKVRERAGLKGIRETWTSSVCLHPDYINDKDRMRDIIHQERLIELAFENQPYWDIVRWMEAESRWNYQPVTGWNIYGSTTASYYRVTTVGESKFSYKDYFSPISQDALDRNPNLKQNPGWQ